MGLHLSRQALFNDNAFNVQLSPRNGLLEPELLTESSPPHQLHLGLLSLQRLSYHPDLVH